MADPTQRIIQFLLDRGIPVVEAELADSTFLPGILVCDGNLQVDRDRLQYPGDLLHEAGHLAVLPRTMRACFGGPDAVTGIDMGSLEVQASAWAYAAALHLSLDPAVVFHDGGYGGHGEGLLRTFALGVYFGVSDLSKKGMAATPAQAAQLGVDPYPHMLAWLCE